MPKVVVYVPAAAWRRLEERGLDPAQAVRDFARSGYEFIDAGPVSVLSERGGGESGVVQIGKERRHDKPEDGSSILPAAVAMKPRSESSDDHFKPDFKKGKK